MDARERAVATVDAADKAARAVFHGRSAADSVRDMREAYIAVVADAIRAAEAEALERAAAHLEADAARLGNIASPQVPRLAGELRALAARETKP